MNDKNILFAIQKIVYYRQRSCDRFAVSVGVMWMQYYIEQSICLIQFFIV
ncbi:hypothetical protein Cha6605_0965 [Chamaesiphon minutus PCC 6605]|uniref:Uncharacterized protein n=1 Tax=Chamaesiphon minutus (strain ATCC 27169 / PCC 6605) TaxID=1173020 RepID=K9UCQ4_CHAP6|nr:hypothetical protein Cha6605_0965 [Chamaesiphon minutus PCC 6605]